MVGTTFFGALLVGCANVDIPALTNCDVSGEARFRGTPLASRTEHQQALRFLPLDPNKCVVYVVREHDSWTGASVRSAAVLLTPSESKHAPFPAKQSDLPIVFGNQILLVDDQIFAAWELEPKNYLLEAFFFPKYGGVYYGNSTVDPIAGSLARIELDCLPGTVKFFAVGDRGYSHATVIRVIGREEGENYVRNGVRGLALLYTTGPIKQRQIYNSCPLKARQ